MGIWDIWFERVIRHQIDTKWGGWPAFLWDAGTVLFGAAVGVAFGWNLLTNEPFGLSRPWGVISGGIMGSAAGLVRVWLRSPS